MSQRCWKIAPRTARTSGVSSNSHYSDQAGLHVHYVGGNRILGVRYKCGMQQTQPRTGICREIAHRHHETSGKLPRGMQGRQPLDAHSSVSPELNVRAGLQCRRHDCGPPLKGSLFLYPLKPEQNPSVSSAGKIRILLPQALKNRLRIANSYQRSLPHEVIGCYEKICASREDFKQRQVVSKPRIASNGTKRETLRKRPTEGS